MNTQHFPLAEEEKKLVIEVMENVRKQEYTPEKLCELQKIIDTQYYYWWMNDMKIEEQAKHLFLDEFDAYFTGVGMYKNTPLNWARNAKYTNSFLMTNHMGHHPMVWLMDEIHARGIFMFECHFTYQDDPDDLVEIFLIYVDDFEKKKDGQWYISNYRLLNTKLAGKQRNETLTAPDDYIIPKWDEV